MILKTPGTEKVAISKIKRQPKGWEEIYVNMTSDEVKSPNFKQLIKYYVNKSSKMVKHGENTLVEIS